MTTRQRRLPIRPVLILAWIGCVHAQLPAELGELFAKESMALVTFAEMGNIGARDPECRGTPFPVTDIGTLVETEIRPIVEALSRLERRPARESSAEVLAALKQIPRQTIHGQGVVQSAYEQKKIEARAAYGAARACAALSSMVQTAIHQKRKSLRDLHALAEARKPR